MTLITTLLLSIVALSSSLNSSVAAEPAKHWHFAVSGDSRNCGDVVMPMIAGDLLKNQAGKKITFYWHLGDFRFGPKIDEDIAHDPETPKPLSMDRYHAIEWQDFINRQLTPFGSTPIYLTIGNHELYGHTREEYVSTFRPWLNGGKSPTIYYSWIHGGVEFLSMDNASAEEFDAQQMQWFRATVAEAEKNPKIRTVVIGMHEALPDSISYGHSMSTSKDPISVTSGREVYASALRLQNQAGKKVYILASHSHFFMEGIFNTPYWSSHGGVLSGWIVGTAGAERYALPKEASQAKQAKTHVYGYLLADVSSDGSIRFDFHELGKDAVPPKIIQRYGSDLVNFCFDQNASEREPRH